MPLATMQKIRFKATSGKLQWAAARIRRRVGNWRILFES